WPESFSNHWVETDFEVVLRFLADVHHEFRLPRNQKQEMFRFLAFLEKRYPTYINTTTVGHIKRLRHNLSLPFKVQERLDYDELLEAERYLLQNVHKCFYVQSCPDVYEAIRVIEAQLERVVQPRGLRHVNAKPLFARLRKPLFARLRKVAAK
ncbi:MAG: hypothetical protein KVP17_005306, partial [Porospora cf. gigantea B]|uniref:uncharacterized protein n=1 Tax=Porospora cf. gigantea B TaxID=2853592 RepID=UPI003571B3CC